MYIFIYAALISSGATSFGFTVKSRRASTHTYTQLYFIRLQQLAAAIAFGWYLICGCCCLDEYAVSLNVLMIQKLVYVDNLFYFTI